jgi:hypothetical protein
MNVKKHKILWKKVAHRIKINGLLLKLNYLLMRIVVSAAAVRMYVELLF